MLARQCGGPRWQVESVAQDARDHGRTTAVEGLSVLCYETQKFPAYERVAHDRSRQRISDNKINCAGQSVFGVVVASDLSLANAAHSPDEPFEKTLHQVVFVFEAIINRATGHTGHTCDIAHSKSTDAVGAYAYLDRVQNQIPSVLTGIRLRLSSHLAQRSRAMAPCKLQFLATRPAFRFRLQRASGRSGYSARNCDTDYGHAQSFPHIACGRVTAPYRVQLRDSVSRLGRSGFVNIGKNQHVGIGRI